MYHFLLPSGVLAFESEVGLFSVLQGSPIEYGHAYQAYHLCDELDCDDEPKLGSFWFTNSSTKVLHASAIR